MAVGMKWRGDEFLKLVDKQIVAGLYAAAVELQRLARKKASIPNAGRKKRSKFWEDDDMDPFERAKFEAASKKGKARDKAHARIDKQRFDAASRGSRGYESLRNRLRKQYRKKKTRSRTIYPNSSRPGESPRRRTGFGQKNIVFGVDESTLVARVGFTRNARYMTFHELGIRYSSGLQQRPTIVPATSENLPRLQAIFQRGAKQVKL